MFYDSKIMNSGNLKNAWRAGNNQELCPDKVPLPKVCKLLDSWIGSDYQDPGRRMSLRSSSILVNGAAKLYQQGLNDLMKDLFELENQMINRNRRSSETELVPDMNTEESEQSENDNESSPGHSASTVRSDSSDVNISGKSKKNNMSISQQSRSKKKHKKTSRPVTPEKNRTNGEELPIGQVFVYDNLTSKVPSKIIVGNINPNVRKNINF